VKESTYSLRDGKNTTQFFTVQVFPEIFYKKNIKRLF
jgi:hypothetical protein